MAAVLQHCHSCEQEASCSLWWSLTAMPNAVIHDILVMCQCNW